MTQRALGHMRPGHFGQSVDYPDTYKAYGADDMPEKCETPILLHPTDWDVLDAGNVTRTSSVASDIRVPAPEVFFLKNRFADKSMWADQRQQMHSCWILSRQSYSGRTKKRGTT